MNSSIFLKIKNHFLENAKYSVWESRRSVEKDSLAYEGLRQQGIPGNMPRSEAGDTGSKVGSTGSEAGSTGSEAGSTRSVESDERRYFPKE